VDSAEEMSRKGEVVMAGLRAAYQKRFEQELEEFGNGWFTRGVSETLRAGVGSTR